jgi:L-ascorbate metabolism protein UlaG (beta-lactamase superfamily)
MTVQITYHGHACFSIQTAQANLLIDPFLTGNAMADVTPEQVAPDYILVTHAHGDHLGDALPIAKRTGATVISNNEIHGYMTRHGVKSHGMHIGGAHVFPVRQGQADHRAPWFQFSGRKLRRHAVRIPVVGR